jgi:predicted DNA-binding transcriptional regulator AlpA
MPYEETALLTEQQLGDELGKSRSTLARWRREGSGPPYIRVGKSPRYKWADVLAWLERQRGQGGAGTSPS